jgi:hypothetical protein
MIQSCKMTSPTAVIIISTNEKGAKEASATSKSRGNVTCADCLAKIPAAQMYYMQTWLCRHPGCKCCTHDIMESFCVKHREDTTTS